MRAVSSTSYKSQAVLAAVWVVIALVAAACEGGGAGGPGVEPPWSGDDINASTSGTGGTAGAGQGAAGVSGASGGAGSGPTPTAGGPASEDGAGGSTPVVAGEGGGVDLGGIGGSGATGTSGTDGSGDAGAPSEPEYTAGCRAPEQSGCEQCCEATTGAGGEPSCLKRSASSGSDWYNSVESLDGPCPGDCAICASCSLRDEEQLASMEARPDCDCNSIVIGIDPCFSPMGCECYCQSYAALAEACPHLVQ